MQYNMQKKRMKDKTGVMLRVDFYPLPVLIMMMMPSALCSVEEENESPKKYNAAMEEEIVYLKTKLKSTAFNVKSI